MNRRLMWAVSRSDVAGAVLIALALPALAIAPRVFYASWLAAWWFSIGLMLGAMANLWIHRLCGGQWGTVLRPAVLRMVRRLPLALLLFVPVAAGLPALYPWAADPAGWAHELAHPAFASAWLQPGFFAARMTAYAALWWWLARPSSLSSGGRAAAALVLYLLSGTLASVDLLMSLVPGWTSSAFGLVVLSGQALGGSAFAVWRLARNSTRLLAAPQGGGAPPLARDLGNLLLMWLMLWAYLAFMEFLIIWAENLPPEIAWYLPRLNGGWAGAGAALALLQFALPLLALLQRRLKDAPAWLAQIAALLVATQLLNCAWLVLPSVDAASPHAAWLVPLLALGMGLLLFGARRAAHTADAPEVSHARP